MRAKRMTGVIAFGILALIMTPSLLAQPASSTEHSKETQTVADSGAIGIVGASVSNESGESLGVVVNVLIARASGRVSALVIGIGGVFGYGSYNYEVPWQRVELTNEAEVRLDVSRDKVSSEFPAYRPRSRSSEEDGADGSEADEGTRALESGGRDESPEKQE